MYWRFLNSRNFNRTFSTTKSKNIVVSTPVDKGNILNVVMGYNDHLLTKEMNIVTAASCTTHCAAPLVGALGAAFGIEMGTIITAHKMLFLLNQLWMY